MNEKHTSFKRQLTKSLLIWAITLWIFSTIAATVVFTEEYDELLDLNLETTAQLMLPIAQSESVNLNPSINTPKLFTPDLPWLDKDESFIFHLLDKNGSVLLISALYSEDLFKGLPLKEGLAKQGGYRLFTTHPNSKGSVLQIAIPLAERNQAIIDNLLSLGVSFLLLLPFMLYSIRYLTKKYGGVISSLSNAIGSRNGADLSPIKLDQNFSELVPTVSSVNALLERLRKSLSNERDFSTNVAHELRTPLAISLAQTQRLKASSNDANVIERSTEIEAGLKRLADLTEKLLQLSRSDAGIGLAAEKTEISRVIKLVVDGLSISNKTASRIKLIQPVSQFLSFIDPDALAIILSNLIDNALKHSVGGKEVLIDAAQAGVIKVINDCEAVSSKNLKMVCTRFQRGSGDVAGFGIGLSIVQSLCTQAGADLKITSPCNENGRGFEVTIELPSAEEHV